jgi:hypothetical protein
MDVQPLFQGLMTPEPIKLDTSSLDTFLEKLLAATLKMDADMQQLK